MHTYAVVKLPRILSSYSSWADFCCYNWKASVKNVEKWLYL